MEIQLGIIIKEPMKLAINLAEQGKYTVSPNPMVGAVLLKDGRLIGYGYHLFQGDKHAEVKAIEMASLNVQGASLYINLEPCCHYGYTPPCINEIIKARIKEVHVATIDPNPLMRGKSIDMLRQANIKVFLGECKQEAENLNERFFYCMTKQLPFVIAKWAMTFDGKIATANFDSKWITSAQTREHSHLIRNSADAILIGTNTAKFDNPRLTVRTSILSNKRAPLRVVVDRDGKLDETLILFQKSNDRTFVIITSRYPKDKRLRLEAKGINFLEIGEENGALDIKSILKELKNLSVSTLLIEGGGRTLGNFLKADLINKFYCYISSKIVGGKDSIGPFHGDFRINFIKDAKQIYFENIEPIGNDFLITANSKLEA
jgi:diaminohydroxyphosphoribosylaminopyrimidine deaminase / 5-amino-6-(5-phosphoribosylamino)uracil reductase